MKQGKILDVYLERGDDEGPARLRPERRKTTEDRRKLHTYIADDRRSGIADRRKRPMTHLAAENRKS